MAWFVETDSSVSLCWGPGLRLALLPQLAHYSKNSIYRIFLCWGPVPQESRLQINFRFKLFTFYLSVQKNREPKIDIFRHN
ncbi:hypothetical protein SS7213T_11395 [Staphylococcus simiae CCM 7213 = CCUG 51256]|uniref:Uncharacterized protein n=1 Tax=Staphylococcus simiae CCM 7213 = CCUG 51256 TaxID=911238 RepID=G5JLB2_9STAP|nr:hypothetical protein SS7213T_11395 [Staphylococcus simiae CCM 7213 = CCUG 51256]